MVRGGEPPGACCPAAVVGSRTRKMAALSSAAAGWPIAVDAVVAARERWRPYLAPTSLRSDPLRGGSVGIVLCGGNLDEDTLRRVLLREV